MKKTLTTILFASVAFAADAAAGSVEGYTMLLYGNTYNLKLNAENVVKRQMNAGLQRVDYNGSLSLTPFADGVRATFKWTSGELIVQDPTKTWTNTAALEDLNETMGLDLTADYLSSMKFIGTQGTNSNTTLTLNFKNAAKNLDLSRSMTFYVFATSAMGSAGDLLVSGLDGYTVTSAAAHKGDGFDNQKGGYNSMTLYKVTGTLNKDKAVTFGTTSSKNAFSLISYLIPEPSTATLSLLALAGLAARRRRVA